MFDLSKALQHVLIIVPLNSLILNFSSELLCILDGVVDLVCVDTFMRPGLKKESTTGDLGNLPKVIMPVSYIYSLYTK